MVATANELCATKWKSLVQNENKVKYFYWNDLLSLTLRLKFIPYANIFTLYMGITDNLKTLQNLCKFTIYLFLYTIDNSRRHGHIF